jgi:hypothetical protein
MFTAHRLLLPFCALAVAFSLTTPIWSQSSQSVGSTSLDDWIRQVRIDTAKTAFQLSIDRLAHFNFLIEGASRNWGAGEIANDTLKLFYDQPQSKARFELNGVGLKSLSYAGGDALWAEMVGGPLVGFREAIHQADLTWRAYAHQNEAQSLAYGGALSNLRLSNVVFDSGFGQLKGSFHSLDNRNHRVSISGSWTGEYGDRSDHFKAQSRYTFGELLSTSGHIYSGTGIVSRERVEQHELLLHEPLLSWISNGSNRLTETTRRSESYNDSFNGMQANQSIRQAGEFGIAVKRADAMARGDFVRPSQKGPYTLLATPNLVRDNPIDSGSLGRELDFRTRTYANKDLLVSAGLAISSLRDSWTNFASVWLPRSASSLVTAAKDWTLNTVGSGWSNWFGANRSGGPNLSYWRDTMGEFALGDTRVPGTNWRDWTARTHDIQYWTDMHASAGTWVEFAGPFGQKQYFQSHGNPDQANANVAWANLRGFFDPQVRDTAQYLDVRFERPNSGRIITFEALKTLYEPRLKAGENSLRPEVPLATAPTAPSLYEVRSIKVPPSISLPSPSPPRPIPIVDTSIGRAGRLLPQIDAVGSRLSMPPVPKLGGIDMAVQLTEVDDKDIFGPSNSAFPSTTKEREASSEKPSPTNSASPKPKKK